MAPDAVDSRADHRRRFDVYALRLRGVQGAQLAAVPVVAGAEAVRPGKRVAPPDRGDGRRRADSDRRHDPRLAVDAPAAPIDGGPRAPPPAGWSGEQGSADRCLR